MYENDSHNEKVSIRQRKIKQNQTKIVFSLRCVAEYLIAHAANKEK